MQNHKQAPNDKSPTMQFGKFKGQPMSAIPEAYLQWAMAQPGLHMPMKRVVLDEVLRRQPPPPTAKPRTRKPAKRSQPPSLQLMQGGLAT